MTPWRKGRPSLKATLRIINVVLAVLAVLAIGFMCYMFFQVQSFYPEDYAHRAQEIRAQADSVRAETERLSQELRTQEEAMAY